MKIRTWIEMAMSSCGAHPCGYGLFSRFLCPCRRQFCSSGCSGLLEANNGRPQVCASISGKRCGCANLKTAPKLPRCGQTGTFLAFYDMRQACQTNTLRSIAAIIAAAYSSACGTLIRPCAAATSPRVQAKEADPHVPAAPRSSKRTKRRSRSSRMRTRHEGLSNAPKIDVILLSEWIDVRCGRL